MKTYLWRPLLMAVFSTRLLIAADDRPSGGEHRPDKHRSVVYLEKSLACDPWAARGYRCILAKEIVRQAFLVSARDQMGLATRDAWLGDPMPAPGDWPPIDLAIVSKPEVLIEIRCGLSSGAKTIAREKLASHQALDYLALLGFAEQLSRAGFAAALQQAGFQGKPVALAPEAAVPAVVEELLSDMTFTSQFAAARELHGVIRSQGESPALVGALVRAYSNLGMLTEFHFHPAHKVFKARALVYAQRLVAQGARPRWGKWHRAYALALAGLHKLALADLESAAKPQKGSPAKEPDVPPPVWVDLIDAHCRYDLDRLKPEQVERANQQLVWLLRYVDVEQAEGSTMAITHALNALKTMPECYRINDGLCRLAGVRILHSATATWLTLAGERLYERVQAIPGLPAEVRTGIVEERNAAADLGPSNEFKLRARLARALIDASRPGAALHASVPESKAAAPAALATSALGEPSWAALGRLIEELSFMQVYRRAEFERTYLAVSTDEFLESAAPLVAGHPCGDFLELLTGRRSRRNAALDRLGKLAADGMEFHWQPLVDKLFEERREARDRLYDCIMEQIDATAREMLLLLGPEFGGSRPANARRVLTVSPYSPLARAVLVESDWKSVAADAAEWEKAGAAHPRVLVAFARHYLASGRPDNTERLLKAAIRIEPAPRVYSELAEMYRDQGRHAEWLATVDECLTKPDYGLNHAMMCSNLARDLMDLGQWKKALPYAERAAQSYSASGLTTYAGCQEGLLDWAKAESATRAVQERYRESLEWYFFCRRTGQGDLDAARQSAQARVEREDWDVGVYRRALYYQLEKKLDKALRLTEGAYAKEKDSFDGIRLALLADELKDARKRDDTLRQVIKLGPRTHLPNNKPQKGTVIVANLLAKDLAAGGKGDIDQKAIQAALAVIEEPADRMNCRYFIGKYLDLRGKHAEGVQCWMKCMACPVVNATCRTLAGAELCGRGIRGEKFGALLQSGEADLPPAKSLPRAPRLW